MLTKMMLHIKRLNFWKIKKCSITLMQWIKQSITVGDGLSDNELKRWNLKYMFIN
jgi:hypothetical protein